jgi:hypothetical protein
MKMNLAITNTSARTWKAVKAHYIIAAAGVALALSSVIGAASLSIDWSGSGSAASRSVPPAVASADQRYVTYYLVGSEAERELVIASENEAALEREFAGVDRSNTAYTVLVAGTPTEVLNADITIYEGMSALIEAGVNVQLVDLVRR